MVILIESANEDENGLLSCSECGATNYQTLIKHIKCKHQMSPKDYLSKYWEVKFAEWLDSLNINYEYEGVKVQYYDPVKKSYRTYYPDFYFPDINLCVEVKPRAYLEDPSVLAKRDACLENGYKFKFITQDELSNLSTDLFNV